MNYTSLDLNKLRAEKTGASRHPFPHQLDAMAALDKTFTFEDRQTKGALLILPTGAGKTFTAVRWLCTNVIPREVKILWLAHSFHLLDQAAETFCDDAREIPRGQGLNIRVISSNPSHAQASSIETTDNVVIMTTQTAISSLSPDALDGVGKRVVTSFRKFLDHCAKDRLLVVLDEAHHAPAYGCRHLLSGMREIVPNLYLLGLTATPDYTDETKRGWLARIFEQRVIYQAKQETLIAQSILALPRFVEMPTGRDYNVDDALYNRLVREHKDLPEEIIEKIANDSPRNDYIVSEYVKNKRQYGKTIIFADRWFQCVYLKEKLLKHGINADAVYSHVDADPGSAAARNARTSDENKKIIEQFKRGKGKDALDVLINVRMLTEGTDVPTVKTVFITRQTTSSILMTQMIGRALRGPKAGGGADKDEADIVLFVDNWKQLINWATPSLDGGVGPGKQVTRYYPIELISIQLVEDLARRINNPVGPYPSRLSELIPVGWYQTDITANTSEGTSDEMQSFVEFAMVYGQTKPKFERFIQDKLEDIPEEWSKESLTDAWMLGQVQPWVATYFCEQDDIGHTLAHDLARLARHIAQTHTSPVYHAFTERSEYDVDELARKFIKQKSSDIEQYEYLSNLYTQPGKLWKAFYKSLYNLMAAVSHAKLRIIMVEGDAVVTPPTQGRKIELTEDEKRQVKDRDGWACQACGATGTGVRLEIDHILPVTLSGEPTIDNSQTLCRFCNKVKGINVINFRNHSSPLSAPKSFEGLFQRDGGQRRSFRNGNEVVARSLVRLVNFFYHCQAVCRVRMHQRRSGSCYSTWEIELYSGNDPGWLLQYKQELVAYIQTALGCPHVEDIKVITAK